MQALVRALEIRLKTNYQLLPEKYLAILASLCCTKRDGPLDQCCALTETLRSKIYEGKSPWQVSTK
jgi:hypothetical protein